MAPAEVAIVGVGMSGIAMAVRLTELGISYKIYDKNLAPGGTWLENGYPAAGCDIPSECKRWYCCEAVLTCRPRLEPAQQATRAGSEYRACAARACRALLFPRARCVAGVASYTTLPPPTLLLRRRRVSRPPIQLLL